MDIVCECAYRNPATRSVKPLIRMPIYLMFSKLCSDLFNVLCMYNINV